MADVTPPANLYAININVKQNMLEQDFKKSEIKAVEVMPQKQKSEIHRISSPREEVTKPKSEIHRISSPREEIAKYP